MKTLKYIAFAFILGAITFSACNKYEDGPKLSLRTKKARLAGDWLIESYTSKGIDSTASFLAYLGANFKFIIEKDGKYSIQGNSTDAGTWKLGEDKDDVMFLSNVAGAKEDSYRILRLKNKELWLKHTESNGDIKIIHYKGEKD